MAIQSPVDDEALIRCLLTHGSCERVKGGVSRVDWKNLRPQNSGRVMSTEREGVWGVKGGWHLEKLGCPEHNFRGHLALEGNIQGQALTAAALHHPPGGYPTPHTCTHTHRYKHCHSPFALLGQRLCLLPRRSQYIDQNCLSAAGVAEMSASCNLCARYQHLSSQPEA